MIKIKSNLVKYFCTSLVLLSSFIVPSFSETNSSQWVEVEESSVFGNNETVDDFKKRLINLAKEKALEEVNGTYIKKSTIVRNKEALSVELTSSTKGVVTEYNQIEYTPPSLNGDRTGKIKIKAKVLITTHFRDQNMVLNANINKNKFYSGDEVVLDIKTNFDGYVTIINVYEDESVAILFPNSLMKNNSIKANQKISFPTDEMRKNGINLVTSLPPKKSMTEESIRVFVSRDPVPLFDSDFKESIYKFVDSKDTKTMNIFFERIYKKIDADRITDKVLNYSIVEE